MILNDMNEYIPIK